MRGPMKIWSMGISQFSALSFLSPLSLLISFLLGSSAEDARCLGLTLVGLLLSLLLLTQVGDVAGDTWSASLLIPGMPPPAVLSGALYWSGMVTPSDNMCDTLGALLLRSRLLMVGTRLVLGTGG